MKTRGGIYFNFDESIFRFKYKELELVFSSKFNLERFKGKYLDYIYLESYKLNKNYNNVVNGDYMFLLKLYKDIEKRGFKVLFKDVELNENYKFNIDLI